MNVQGSLHVQLNYVLYFSPFLIFSPIFGILPVRRIADPLPLLPDVDRHTVVDIEV